MKRQERIAAGPAAATPPDTTTLTTHVELATRQLGGGVAAREVDPGLWLRPSAVRGALRFWWRALFGGVYSDTKTMRTAENAVFGGPAMRDKEGRLISGPGTLVIDVTATLAGPLETWTGGPANPLTTAYFGASVGGHKLLRSAEASVSLRGASGEVLEAVRAWLTFGGSGGRTRRGAGHLRVKKFDATTSPLASEEQLTTWLKRSRAPAPTPRNFFLIEQDSRFLVSSKTHSSADDAQKVLLEGWRNARGAMKAAEMPRGAERQRWGLPLKGIDDAGRYASPVLLGMLQEQNGWRPVVLITRPSTPSTLKDPIDKVVSSFGTNYREITVKT